MEKSGEALNEFGVEVLRALRREKLPPLPEYYELFFDVILQTKNIDVRKEVSEQLEFGHTSDFATQMATLEVKLKEHSKTIKEVLNNMNSVHKQMLRSLSLFQKYATEAEKLNNPSATASLASLIKHDTSLMVDFFNSQSELFQNLYQKSTEILQQVEIESIFDLQYGVFNKRYLIAQASHEQKLISRFNHTSSIVTVRPSKSIVIGSEKSQMLANKTIAKLLMRSSRRSDIVSYVGNNTFGILLKHTDAQNAMKTCDRICDMIAAANFFLGDREIELKVHCGVSLIDNSCDIEDLLRETLTRMNSADEHDLPFIYEESAPKQDEELV